MVKIRISRESAPARSRSLTEVLSSRSHIEPCATERRVGGSGLLLSVAVCAPDSPLHPQPRQLQGIGVGLSPGIEGRSAPAEDRDLFNAIRFVEDHGRAGNPSPRSQPVREQLDRMALIRYPFHPTSWKVRPRSRLPLPELADIFKDISLSLLFVANATHSRPAAASEVGALKL